MDITSGDSTLVLSDDRATLLEARFQQVKLLQGIAALFNLALPLPEDLPHRLTAPQHATTKSTDTETQFLFETLRSPRGEFQISATLRIRPQKHGTFSLQLTLINHTPHVIPQVLFPYLQGLHPTGEPKSETLHLGRSVKYPYTSMDVPDGAVSFYDLYRRWYFEYGMQDWNLKWFRLGNKRHGVAVHSTELGATVQGLYVEREKTAKRLTIAWAHYPHIAPGETWVSPEFILYPHAGDWREGIAPYKQFAVPRLPTAPTTRYLHGSLGARSVFFSTYLYDNDPNFRYRDLPAIARDALAHGLREVVAWFIFRAYFELPMQLNPKLGTADELRDALAECRAMGVNVTAFVSLRSLKSSTAPPTWFEQDELGNRRAQAWSYSLNFVPAFNPPYCHRDESAFVCPGAPEYRAAYLKGCAALYALGFSSVCFDQLFADRLCYAAGHTHEKPNDILTPLHSMVRQSHALGRRSDPDASLSGEFYTDVSQTFQHYNWDWIGGSSPLSELDPFRHVFPKYRLGLLVDRSKRWLLEGFTRGLFLNFLPAAGEGLISHDSEFSHLVQVIARYRAAYARFFENGEYLGAEPLRGTFKTAAIYRHAGEYLLIASNPTDAPAPLELTINLPGIWGPIAEMLPPWAVRLIHVRADGSKAVIC